jgi:hypothetical protein
MTQVRPRFSSIVDPKTYALLFCTSALENTSAVIFPHVPAVRVKTLTSPSIFLLSYPHLKSPVNIFYCTHARRIESHKIAQNMARNPRGTFSACKTGLRACKRAFLGLGLGVGCKPHCLSRPRHLLLLDHDGYAPKTHTHNS